MVIKNVLDTITKYREERGWTEYRLAEESGLPQSTISSWYRKQMMPSIISLEKICNAFGITVSQFFLDENTAVSLTQSQRELITRWVRLDKRQQTALLNLLDSF